MDVINEDKLRYLAGKHGFNLIYLEKDYFLTIFLYLIRNIDGLYFKGGTALNKIFLDNLRLSEDLDFTARTKIETLKKNIENSIDKNIFYRLKIDHFTKDFIRYHIYFKSYFEKESFIMVDINKKASMHLKPEFYEVKNFYGLDFKVKTLNIDEIIAEKIRSLILRNQPRDYFDIYFVLKKYRVNRSLVNKKLKEVNATFDKERIFKNAQKIFSRWEKDLLPLTNRKISFIEVIKELKKNFGYKS